MPCLDEPMILAFLAGDATPELAARVELEIDRCAACRELVAAVARLAEPRSDDASTQRYELERRIGAGGMGIVYVAFDRELERRVALKVILEGHDARRGADRMLREARTMAQLQHANVVRIYDVGRSGGDLYIAMELLEGGTLSAWLDAGERPWRSIVRVFVEAGRGLAAAHERGIVHRDFKPSNVLLERSGEGDAEVSRVAVGDFGLARPLLFESPPTRASGSGDGSISTLSGAGTPRYMAPEQQAGAPADARSDQYSFAVALYEALHGRHPSDASVQVRRASPSRHIDVALRKMLAPEPGQRYPSMTEALQALESTPRHRSHVAGGIVVAAIGVAVFSQSAAPSVCDDAPHAARWERQQVELEQRMLASGSQGEHVWRVIEPRLGNFVTVWQHQHGEVCEAVGESGTMTTLLERRAACLDARMLEFTAHTDVLATIEPGEIDRALVLSEGLPDLSACSAERLLEAPGRNLSPEIEVLRERAGPEFAHADAEQRLGRLLEAQEVFGEWVPRVVAAGDHELAARGSLHLGAIASLLGARGTARAHLEAAAAHALRADRDDIAAESWLSLAELIVEAEPESPHAHTWLELARAALDRASALGTTDTAAASRLAKLRTSAMAVEATRARHRGDYGTARELLEQVVAQRLEQWDPDAPECRTCLKRARMELATVLYRQGELDAAEAHVAAVRADDEQTLGPTSKLLAEPLELAARIELARGHHDEAIALLDDVIDRIHEEQPTLYESVALQTRGNAHRNAGHIELARADLQTALRMRATLLGDEAIDTVTLHGSLGLLELTAGHPERALEHYLSMQPMVQSAGNRHMLALWHANMCDVLAALRREGDAREHCTTAKKHYEAVLGASHEHTREVTKKLAQLR